MKCQKCGAELAPGVTFCRECGTKVIQKKKFCRECGAALSDGMKFCSECGASVNMAHEGATVNKVKTNHASTKSPVNKLDSMPKIRDIGKGENNTNKAIIAIIAIGCIVVLGILALALCGGKNDKNKKVANACFDEIVATVDENAILNTGTEFAYMSDAWNVYIATAVSEKVIKIEHWDKSSQSAKKMKLNKDLGSFKIDEEANGFMWIDDQHTAFTFSLTDKNNSHVKKGAKVIFTINTSSSDNCKGTNYDDDIACYTYTNDDWHMYRAIALNENLIKVECWYRTSSGFLSSYLYAWDLGVIDLTNTKTDFEWSDNDHKAFTITMRDPENGSEWKSEKLVSFILENEKYKYPTVDDFFRKNDEKDNQESEIESTTEEKEEVTKEPVEDTKEEVTKEPVEDTKEEQVKEKEEQIKEQETVSYSTNTKSTVKNGNSGVYAYKQDGAAYDMYYIVDFDENYVYWFTEGNDEETCDRLKIDSGDLNDVLVITYHDGDTSWSYGLHFKYKNQPDHLIMEDNDHFEYDYYTTNLKDALKLRDSKTMHDY